MLVATWISTLLLVTAPSVQLPPIQQPVPVPGGPQQPMRPPPQQQPLPQRPFRPAGQMPGGPMTSVYTSPGVATLQGGQWVGAEHLYNLQTDIGVVVEIILPSGRTIPISDAVIRERVMPILRNGGLSPKIPSGASPMPFLHFLIMVNPIEKGFVAYCSGRLFENVDLKRVRLDPNLSWQAVTWEKQELLIFGTEQLVDQLSRCIETIATAFIDRLRSYQVRPPS